MKRLPKKTVRILGVLLGVVLLTVVGLRVFFPAEKVKDMAVSLASEKLGRSVGVAEVGLSFAGGLGVKLGGVTVANPAGFTGEPLFGAEMIDLKLQLRPLFRGEIQVNRLVIDHPRARLLRRADGTDNFTFDVQSSEEGSLPSSKTEGTQEPADLAVRFDRIEMRGGRLSFLDESTGQRIDLVELSWAGDLSNPDPGLFRSAGFLAVDSLLVSGPQPLPSFPAEMNYELSYDLNRSVLDLEKGDLEVGGLPLEMTGRMEGAADSLRANGVLRASGVSLADLSAFLSPEQREELASLTYSGDVSVEAELDFDRSRETPLAYEGRLVVAGLRASSDQVEGELQVREVRIDFRPDEVQVATEGGDFAGQPLEVAVTVVDFDHPLLEGRVAGELDLAFVEPFLPPEKNISLAGRCRLESTFAGGIENVQDMDYSGTAVFTDVFYADPALPDTLHTLNGAVTFDQGMVAVEKMEAIFGAGDLSLTGKLTRHLPYFLPENRDNRDNLPKPEFIFAARSRRIDIDRLFPAAAPATEASQQAGSAGLRDTLTFDAIPDLMAQGTLEADTLIYSRVPFTKVKGKVRLMDRVLECYDVTTGVYGGTAGGEVVIDLNNLNDPVYGGAFTAADIEADNFISRFTGISGILFGKTGISGSFSARGRDPAVIRNSLTLDSVAGLVSGKVVTGEFVTSALGSLAAQTGQKLDKEQTLKDLTTLLKVQDGRVGVDQFKTRLGQFGDLSLGGSYGFAGDLEYSGSLLLSKEQTAKLYASGGLAGSIAQLFGDKAERLRLPISVDGTMKKPRLNIDYTELTNNLKSQAQDDLKEELGNKLKGLFGK